MLNSYSFYNGVFVEITKSKHKHGGEGWEFGTCLWSPATDKRGGDRYSIMRKPQKGDLILHFYLDIWKDGITESRLCGYSFVARPFKVMNKIPPSPGNWGKGDSYYRIDLEGLTFFKSPLPFSTIEQDYSQEILNELIEDKPRYFPFNTYGDSIRTVQGTYLSICTNRLFDLFMDALNIQLNVDTKNPKTAEIHKEYIEEKRMARERYFFSRNPQLVKDAKEKYKYKCQVCGFDFSKYYGEIGDGYIEAHHKYPLSERPESKWSNELMTRLEDINVVCANCHRMIHRKKPALSIHELIDYLHQQKSES